VPAGLVPGRAVVFYPGSSIGNFNADQALRLLRQARGLSEGGALLIGVDLVKPKPVLEAAYDDALGVTGAFNLNLLRHLNRLLGADFDLRQWQHVALYDEAASRIEMHLQARVGLTVRWPGASRAFAPRRAHPHRELLQVAAGGLSSPSARGRLCPRADLDRPPGLVRGDAGAGLMAALLPQAAQVLKPAKMSLRSAGK
jgi:hypothetical protein